MRPHCVSRGDGPVRLDAAGFAGRLAIGAARLADELVLPASAAFEAMAPWADKRPAMA